MQKITQIIEAKNVEIYNNGCIKSIDNTDNFLLKFSADNIQNLKLVLDKEYDNNFSFSIYKDFIVKDIYSEYIVINGDDTQNFAIIGVK
jgi:hypothetical protein